MTDVNLLDQVLTSNPDAKNRRPTPPGPYKAVVRAYKAIQNTNNGNRGIEFEFGLLEATGEQDMEGVSLDRAIGRMTVWVTDKTAGINERQFTELGVFDGASTPMDMAEAAVGNEVNIVLEHRKRDVEANKEFPQLDVVVLGTFDNRGGKRS